MDYETLNPHRGHKIQTFGRYDEIVGIECVDCRTDILTVENKNFKYRFTVWVGGVEVNDHLLTEPEADEVVAHYLADGYTDVVKEEVNG